MYRSGAITGLVSLAWVVLGLSQWALVGPARAQEPPRRPDARERRPGEPPPQRGVHHPDQPEHPNRRAGDSRPAEWRPRPRWGRGIFDPAEQDRGPLRPGEEEELQKFIQEKLPRLARLLRQIEEQTPGSVHSAFPRLVPRLRHLRRIHGENPELAQLIEQHAANLFRIEMLRRAWFRADGEQRDPIERQMRLCLAENLGVEIDGLNRWADELAGSGHERVAAQLARLTRPGADLAGESQDVRTRVEEWATADEARRGELTGELNALLGHQLDREIAGIRQRAEELRANAPQEVDRRLARFLQTPGPRGPKP